MCLAPDIEVGVWYMSVGSMEVGWGMGNRQQKWVGRFLEVREMSNGA